MLNLKRGSLFTLIVLTGLLLVWAGWSLFAVTHADIGSDELRHWLFRLLGLALLLLFWILFGTFVARRGVATRLYAVLNVMVACAIGVYVVVEDQGTWVYAIIVMLYILAGSTLYATTMRNVIQASV